MSTLPARKPLALSPEAFLYTRVGLDSEFIVREPQSVTAVLRPPIELTTDAITTLHKAISVVSERVLAGNVLGTFAAGGLPILNALIPIFMRRERLDPTDDVVRKQSRSKFFLMPSLTWECEERPPVDSFRTWLNVQREKRVLLMDTTFSGGGIIRIVNEIERANIDGVALPECIRILGIFDRSRGHPQPSDFLPQFGRTSVEVEILPVSHLFSEDVPRLIGYYSLRDRVGLQPGWFPGVFVIRRPDGHGSVVGALPVATAVWDYVIEPTKLDSSPFLPDKDLADALWDQYAMIAVHLESRGVEKAIREYEGEARSARLEYLGPARPLAEMAVTKLDTEGRTGAGRVRDERLQAATTTLENSMKEVQGETKTIRRRLEECRDEDDALDCERWDRFLRSLSEEK